MFTVDEILKASRKYDLDIAYGGFYDRKKRAACPVAILTLQANEKLSGQRVGLEDISAALGQSMYYLSGVMQGFDFRYCRPQGLEEPDKTEYLKGWETGKKLREDLEKVYIPINILSYWEKEYVVNELQIKVRV